MSFSVGRRPLGVKHKHMTKFQRPFAALASFLLYGKRSLGKGLYFVQPQEFMSRCVVNYSSLGRHFVPLGRHAANCGGVKLALWRDLTARFLPQQRIPLDCG